MKRVIRQCGHCEKIFIADADGGFITCWLRENDEADVFRSVCGLVVCSEECAADHAGKGHGATNGDLVEIR